MKKTIAILAVMVIALGCVFAADGATETHSIKLKTQVGGEVPVFQLVYTSGAKTGESATTNDAEAKYDASTAHTYDATIDEVEVQDISKQDISVVFTAVLANEAKQVEDYELKFTAGDFNVKKNGVAKTIAATTKTVAVAADIADCLGVVAGQVSGQILPLRFNGTTCAAGNLATFSVVYPQDTAVDPSTAEEEFYYATITLEIIAK